MTYYRILKDDTPALVVSLFIRRDQAIIGRRHLTSMGWAPTSFIGCDVEDVDKVIEVVDSKEQLTQRLYEKAAKDGVMYLPLQAAIESSNMLLMWPMMEPS